MLRSLLWHPAALDAAAALPAIWRAAAAALGCAGSVHARALCAQDGEQRGHPGLDVSSTALLGHHGTAVHSTQGARDPRPGLHGMPFATMAMCRCSRDACARHRGNLRLIVVGPGWNGPHGDDLLLLRVWRGDHHLPRLGRNDGGLHLAQHAGDYALHQDSDPPSPPAALCGTRAARFREDKWCPSSSVPFFRLAPTAPLCRGRRHLPCELWRVRPPVRGAGAAAATARVPAPQPRGRGAAAAALGAAPCRVHALSWWARRASSRMAT